MALLGKVPLVCHPDAGLAVKREGVEACVEACVAAAEGMGSRGRGGGRGSCCCSSCCCCGGGGGWGVLMRKPLPSSAGLDPTPAIGEKRSPLLLPLLLALLLPLLLPLAPFALPTVHLLLAIKSVAARDLSPYGLAALRAAALSSLPRASASPASLARSRASARCWALGGVAWESSLASAGMQSMRVAR